MEATQAIIWDYDGTLVDTRLRNYQVNRAIMEVVTGKSADEIGVLRSFERHEAADVQSTNWQDLYLNGYGLSEEQTEEAGRLWAEYQLKDRTPSFPFEGISEVVKAFGHLPQGVVSQNGSEVIQQVLADNGLDGYFSCIVGYEEVANDRQKPAPDGLLMCLERLTGFASGSVYYIGDNETDAQCVAQAKAVLKQRGLGTEVICIGAFYGRPADPSRWTVRPDYSVSSPAEIVRIVNNRA